MSWPDYDEAPLPWRGAISVCPYGGCDREFYARGYTVVWKYDGDDLVVSRIQRGIGPEVRDHVEQCHRDECFECGSIGASRHGRLCSKYVAPENAELWA